MSNPIKSIPTRIAAAFFSPRDAETKNRTTLIFHFVVGTIIFVFTVSLRVNLLAPSSLWLDDAWVALVARMNLSQVIQMGMTSFGFYVILWSWLHVESRQNRFRKIFR